MTATPDVGPGPAGPTLFGRFRALLLVIDRVSYWAIVVVMGLMAAIVALQVFFRYALGSSIDSADELSRLFFVWAMFLAIPHGIRRGVHVGIDIVVKALHPAVQEHLYRLVSALGAALMAAVCYATIFVTADKWQELMPTVDVTAAVYYVAVLIAAGHAFLHLLVLAWQGSRAWQGVAP